MKTNATYYGDVLAKTSKAICESGVLPSECLIIRDIYGQVRVALEIQATDEQIKTLKTHLSQNLGVYTGGNGEPVLLPSDFFDPSAVFNDSAIIEIQMEGYDVPFRLLDRQIVGQDWVTNGEQKTPVNPRIVFYGFKGGVGRSTALALTGYTLAREGKRVLMLDLDLESPGLSSLLLSAEQESEFGLIDWLTEDAVGQGDAVLKDLVIASSLAQDLPGDIRIVPAVGRNGKEQYLSKLSRIYADIPRAEGTPERFADRIRRLLETLEEQEKPDVVLLDSRAGLHDLAAISIVGLSTTAFLFASNADQSWLGYNLLFSHWKNIPKMLASIRDRLVMVYALFPETDQERRAQQFLEKSYDLFCNNMYEEQSGDESDAELFNFALNDTDAPHAPVRVLWNTRFLEFTPDLLGKSILKDSEIEATFGALIDNIRKEISSGENAV